MLWKRIVAVMTVLLLLGVACMRTLAAAAGLPEQESVPTAADQPEALPVAAAQQVSLSLPCKAALLMSSDTGEVLYEAAADEQLPMASITKVMTLLLTFEAMDAGKVTPEDTVTASEHAYSMGGSQIWLEPGEQFSLHEMLKAICVSSANDAAVAVAEFIGGSEDAFVQMMNERASQLGMTHTCFKNACGLDEEGHYSSARDIAVMSLELMKHEKIFEYTGIWTDTLRGGATQLTNTNKLLRSYDGITGLKTGTTGRAGVCISATATRGKTGLIAVVLGAASSKERFEAAKMLLDYGFANFECTDFPVPEALPGTLRVCGGAAEAAPLVCELPRRLLVRKGEAAQLRCEVTVQPQADAPLAAGQQVGQVRLLCGEEERAAYPVTVGQAVEKMNFALAMDILWERMFRL